MRYVKLLFFIPLVWLTACANSPETYIASADSVVMANDLSSANSASRKIIRTADIRCRVANVYTALDTLEKMVTELDGFIADSRMESIIASTETIPYKADSQKIVKGYTATAHITLRIPAMYLDTVMQQVPALASYIDNRKLNRQDVTLLYLANAMKNETAGVSPPVVAGKKEGEIVKNTKLTHIDTGKKTAVIDRRIQNLQLLDDANFATLQVELYQPQMVDVQVVADMDGFTKVPFSTRASMALAGGLRFFQAIAIAFINIWPLWLLLLAGLLIYKKIWIKRLSPKKVQVTEK